LEGSALDNQDSDGIGGEVFVNCAQLPMTGVLASTLEDKEARNARGKRKKRRRQQGGIADQPDSRGKSSTQDKKGEERVSGIGNRNGTCMPSVCRVVDRD